MSNKVQVDVTIYEGLAKHHFLTKEMFFDFKPEIRDQIRLLSQWASEPSPPILTVPVAERYYNFEGTMFLNLEAVVVQPTYETQQAFSIRRINYSPWSLTTQELLDFMDDSGWVYQTGDDRERY